MMHNNQSWRLESWFDARFGAFLVLTEQYQNGYKTQESKNLASITAWIIAWGMVIPSISKFEQAKALDKIKIKNH